MTTTESSRSRATSALRRINVGCRALAMLVVCACFTEAAEHRASDVAELRRAISSAGPGQTIVMTDGRWRDADIDFAAVGEPERPITLRAQTPGKVVLCGRSRVRIGCDQLSDAPVLRRPLSRTDVRPRWRHRTSAGRKPR